MTNLPKNLIDVSLRISERVPFWVQGAGGNTSLKDGDLLWIKSSGFRLDQITKPRGLACVQLPQCHASLKTLEATANEKEQAYNDLLQKCQIQSEDLGRPSMETGFHVLLPRKWVFHFHALSALLLSHLNSKDPQKVQNWVRTSPLKFQFVPAVRPGYILSKTLAQYPNADVIILESHGVVLHGETAGVLDHWEEFEMRFLQAEFGDKATEFRNFTLESAIAHFGGDVLGPFKLYFPDTAVFLRDLSELLTSAGNDNYALLEAKLEPLMKEKETNQKAINLAEIWVATQMLYQLAPDLAELPRDIAASVATLPTELYRRGLT